MRSRLTRLRHTLAACLAAAPLVAAAAAPAFPDDAEIRRMLAVRVDQQGQATGIVIGLTGPHGRRVVTYGSAAAGRGALSGATVFDIGSVTKVFTALLLADMVRRGELKLDDAMAGCLPAAAAKLPPRGGRPITLLDLATHTAGLPLRPFNLPSKDPHAPYAGYTPALLFAALSSLHPDHDPGARYQYSNLGYGLLARALAQRAGKPFDELLRSRITGPLGMADTTAELRDDFRGRLATGYDARLRPVPHWEFGALDGAGGLRSTANDLLDLLDAALGRRQTALAPALKMTAQPRRPGPDAATAAALGWNVSTDRAHPIVWKNGSVGGFRSYIGYDPAGAIGVVALANAQTGFGADDIALHLLDPAEPVNLYTADGRRAVQLAPRALDRYVGRYRFASDNTVLSVSRDGDRLWSQQDGQQDFQLFAESDGDFFLKALDIQLHFEHAGSGPAGQLVVRQDGQEDRAARLP
ncbi:MAG: serine hydrolase [Nevskia sp.]|nr:serine hydrolase [Nevskia sp.]